MRPQNALQRINSEFEMIQGHAYSRWTSIRCEDPPVSWLHVASHAGVQCSIHCAMYDVAAAWLPSCCAAICRHS